MSTVWCSKNIYASPQMRQDGSAFTTLSGQTLHDKLHDVLLHIIDVCGCYANSLAKESG